MTGSRLIQLNLWGLSAFEDVPELPAFLRGHGHVSLAREVPGRTDPLASSLGLNPALHPVAEGPLVVACHRASPPPRSVHFVLSPLSLDSAGVLGPAPVLESREWGEIRAAAQSLATRDLTVLADPDALVWEQGSMDLGMTPAYAAIGKPYLSARPEGDGESLFRRLIDDSANLLFESELNKRRLGEGKPTVDIWWPWGPGFEPRWPNLPLRHGVPVRLFSPHKTLIGAATLAHVSASGAKPKPPAPGEITIYDEHRMVDTDPERALSLLEREIWPGLETQIEAGRKDGLTVLVLDPGAGPDPALVARFLWPDRTSNGVPFASRARNDAGAPLVNLWEFVSESWHLAFAPPTSASGS